MAWSVLACIIAVFIQALTPLYTWSSFVIRPPNTGIPSDMNVLDEAATSPHITREGLTYLSAIE